jgi:chromosome segregation ATPase
MVRDRKKLEDMNKRIAEGRQRVAEQEARVTELRHDGQSTEDATKLPNEIKETLRLMQEHRDQLLRGKQPVDRGRKS